MATLAECKGMYIQVHASPGKGNGAFAQQLIPKGTYIGNYDGELLSEAAFWKRYPDGVVSGLVLLQTHALAASQLSFT